MINYILHQKEIELQEYVNKKGEVFCPMCEIFHVNNTLCQWTGALNTEVL